LRFCALQFEALFARLFGTAGKSAFPLESNEQFFFLP
jgi:hypothetical protein